MLIILSFNTLKLMCWTSQKWQTVCESIETSKVVLQWFSFTFTKVVWSRKGLSPYEKKYDAKLPKLYQIRGRADIQYSGRAQRAQIQEKKNIIVQCYLIFTSSTLQFFTNMSIINERVSISILISAKKISQRDNLMLWNVPHL